MENEELKVDKLKLKGYNPVYIWNAESNEEDLDHSHTFDTLLTVLVGEIEIRIDGISSVLKSGDEMIIPRGEIHYGKAGENGCKYIVAERH